MTRTYRINEMQLSGYHAGQIVEMDATIVCVGRRWVAVISRLDRSYMSSADHTCIVCSTLAAAERAIRDAGLIVQTDHWVDRDEHSPQVAAALAAVRAKRA